MIAKRDFKDRFQTEISTIILFIIICLIVITSIVCFPSNILSWDTFGYYLYLPQLFISNDLGIQDVEHLQGIVDTYHNTGTLYQIWETETGNMLIRYTSGQAVLFAPFFLIAHLITLLTGGVADGFSLPYQIAIFAGCMVYFIIAMFLLRRILRHFFSDKVTTITLCLLLLGTNLLANTLFGIASIHTQLFFLYTILIYFTIRWHKSHTWKNIIFIAIAAGLIILTRPTDIICLLIPFFWNISSMTTFKEKMILYKQYFIQILVSAVIVIAIGSIQIIYWKVFSNHYILDSYNNPGEGMEFFRPFLKETLFSFRKGWFVYTPLMFFALFGIIAAFKRGKECAVAVLLFVVFNIYLVSCWSCWWYADSFGQRAYIQSYAVMSLPLGFMVQFIMERSNRIKILIFIFLGLICALNLFQTWQYRHDIISSSRMTKAAYFANFFCTDKSVCNESLFLIPRDASGEEVMDPHRHYTEHLITTQQFEGDGFEVAPGIEFSPAVQIPYSKITDQDHAWMRIVFWVKPLEPIVPESGYFTVTFRHKEGNYKYRSLPLSSDLEIGEWNKIEINYLTPEVRNENDALNVYFWNPGNTHLLIRQIDIYASIAE